MLVDVDGGLMDAILMLMVNFADFLLMFTVDFVYIMIVDLTFV